ncbi:peptidoglycan recognition family protein [Clostridium sp. AL.422]|uniref:peptidoglycan recognition protein family protein n=1 Tax=Clostridium TaxID=1485 RepID=UPI00293DE92E|nr:MULTISPECIES: peptidoglycan recognition family protein [unclassified Clostridium]MDV4150611.1 peptidoglycan recognition family protein [Clostridium sp. AL.422]
MIIILRIKRKYIYFLLSILILILFGFIFRTNIREYFKISYKNYYNIDITIYEINEMKNKLEIVDIDYKWNGDLIKNNNPNKIIIHHSAREEWSPEEVDKYHKSKGWKGIGYNFYIRKDGTIYSGRPEDSEGAHTIGENSSSIGICLEGNFEKEEATTMQIDSLKNLSIYLSLKYDVYKIIGHKDVYDTLCPGKNFPLDIVKNEIVNSIKEYENGSL